MQNISFLAIVAVLLGCAFFFSQQTKLEEEGSGAKIIPSKTPQSKADIPDCTDELGGEEAQACLSEAVEISEQLVEDMMDRVLAMETDPERRIDFREIQFAWEDSRDADCNYVRRMHAEDDQGEIDQAACLRDHNLARLEQLQEYLCEWYPDSSCSETVTAEE